MIIPLPRLTKNMHFELYGIYVDGKTGNINAGSLFLKTPPPLQKEKTIVVARTLDFTYKKCDIF